MELNTARMLHDLNIHSKINEEDVKNGSKKITEAEKIELDELQEQAVMEAVSNGLPLLSPEDLELVKQRRSTRSSTILTRKIWRSFWRPLTGVRQSA